MKTYKYWTCCVDLHRIEDVESLQAMVSRAQRVTYRTMLGHCQGLLDWAVEHGYVVRGQDLRMKNDWHISYHKSVFLGRPCYFLRWSGIEFIWGDTTKKRLPAVAKLKLAAPPVPGCLSRLSL